jgi:hypothetical protein
MCSTVVKQAGRDGNEPFEHSDTGDQILLKETVHAVEVAPRSVVCFGWQRVAGAAWEAALAPRRQV